MSGVLQEGEGRVRAPAGVGSAKSVDVTMSLLYQTITSDELIPELRAIWERVKVSLPDEAITYDAAPQTAWSKN